MANQCPPKASIAGREQKRQIIRYCIYEKEHLVRVARVRDPVHHRLVPLAIGQSIAIASSLESLLERYYTDQLWHGRGDQPIADVVLTDSGLAAAREILLADGWPSPRR